MQCPNCKVDLVTSDRQGVEIDYCPKCRGVRLDRGELDKIIEKSLASEPPAKTARHPQQRPAAGPPYYQGGEGDEGGYYGRRRKSLLKDIFDF
jgi:Zn-finger nucleic acid-binding protein